MCVLACRTPFFLHRQSADGLPGKVGDTLKAIPEGAAAATYQWLADGVAIPGEDDETLLVTSLMVGKRISVTVTAEDGEEATSEETARVKSDKSAEVTISDLDGLQTDGTGIVGDTLHLSYGSELGVPQLITWYYNGAVAKSLRADAEELNNILNLATGGPIYREGEYYAIITNTEGDTFASNTLTLTFDELKAEITNFEILDDLNAAIPANITFKAKDATAVMKVTMSKDYPGTFYVFDSKVEKFTAPQGTVVLDNTKANDGYYDAVNAGVTWLDVNTADLLTAKRTLAVSGTVTSDGSTLNGLRYVAPTGEVTYMWAIDTTGAAYPATLHHDEIKRGTSYKIAYDQEGVETDNITADARTDVDCSDDFTAPYLPAPASIAVTFAAAGAPAKVTFYDDNGDKMSWLTATTIANAGFDKVEVLEGTSAEKADMTKVAVGGVFAKGVYTGNTDTNPASTYFYATAATTEGVYGAESVKLESPIKSGNVAVAASVELSEDSTTATQGNIKLKGLAADATVYVYNKTDLDSKGITFDKDASSTYVGSVDVEAGDGSKTIGGVFAKDNIGDEFVAVVIPDDGDKFAQIDNVDATTGKAFILNHTATSVAYDAEATVLSDVEDSGSQAANGVVTLDGGKDLVVKDQFGTTIDGSDTFFTPIVNKAASVTASDAGGAFREGGTAVYSVDKDGALSFALTRSSYVDAGDGYDVTILGSKFALRTPLAIAAATEIVEDPTADAWELKLGSDKIHAGAAARATLTVKSDLGLEAALVEANKNAKDTAPVTVTGGAANIAITKALTIGANTILSTAATTNTITVGAGGVLNNYGTITSAGADLFVNTAGIVNMYGGSSFTAGGVMTNNSVFTIAAAVGETVNFTATTAADLTVVDAASATTGAAGITIGATTLKPTVGSTITITGNNTATLVNPA